MAVEKEFWTGLILEKPIPDGSFLLHSRDLSEWSDGKVLHFAEAGISPKVFTDNNTYPLGIVKREDVPKEIPLHTFDTENTQHTNLEKIEESASKAESIAKGHKNAIYKDNCKLALFNWCPQKDSVDTPVLETTGEVVNGRKRLTYNDLLAFSTRFLDIDVSEELAICLCNQHLEDLRLEDTKRYNQLLTTKSIGEFKVFHHSKTPTFNATTKEKEALNAAKGENSMCTSLVWTKEEVSRCEGEVMAFISENDPQYRGDIIGYQKRFTALPMRNFGIGAIYSAKA